MKKFVWIFLMLAGVFTVKAQIELKSNPLAMLLGTGTFSLEYMPSQSTGLEFYGYATGDISGIYLSGKYYFNPKVQGDSFHVGGFLGTVNKTGGIGFLIGYKWLSKDAVVFELGSGVGRDPTGGGFLPYLKFDLGYRFKPKKNKNGSLSSL